MKRIIILENFEFNSNERVNIKDFLDKFQKFNENCFIKIEPEINSDDVFIEVSRYETEDEKNARIKQEIKTKIDKLSEEEAEIAISLLKDRIKK